MTGQILCLTLTFIACMYELRQITYVFELSRVVYNNGKYKIFFYTSLAYLSKKLRKVEA